MSEGHEIPKNLESVVELERPKWVMRVRLPLVEADEETKYVRLGMHTDMMGVLTKTLWGMKPEIKEKLLIQGRIIPSIAVWRRFRKDPAYRFFYECREHAREKMNKRRKVIKLILPRDIKLSDKQIREFSKIDFTPESLSEKYRFKVGWYSADYLARQSSDSARAFNSLAPFLGAVNQFEIGSNKLSSGILRMVGFKLIQSFEEYGYETIIRSGVSRLSWETLNKISRIVEL